MKIISVIGISAFLFVAHLCVAESRSNIYSAAGKRDPFRPPAILPSREVSVSVNPAERYSLEQFQLRAIIKGIGRSRAMFEDPDQKSYILFEGDTLGRERATLSRILDRGVIVTERTFNYLGEESLFEKVISLPVESSEVAGGSDVGPLVPKGGNPRDVTAAAGVPPVTPPSDLISTAMKPVEQAVEKSIEKQVRDFVSPTPPSRVQPIQITPMNPLVPTVPNATPLQETQP